VGGGVGYTWYMGQHDDGSTLGVATPVEATPAPVIKPSKPSPNAPVGASVQMLTTPVVPGENASITVKTTPMANCTIKVEYNKVASTDSGLIPKAADEFGIIGWSWTVEESVPLGTWPVTVTCTYNKKSAMVRGDLVVKLDETRH
jgi:hypothetical protein